MEQIRKYDVVVLGAGAAGLMAAHIAGQRSRKTLVLDHADSAGKKILISGGGRANFTNINASAANYISQNQHFVRAALARYTPQDFLGLVERHHIPWHEKHLGQLFCDRSARDIVHLLLTECAAAGVELQLGTSIHSVRPESAGGFRVTTSKGPYHAQSVVVATGGLSIPKMGATGFGYELAETLELDLVTPRPALVPFTFSEPELSAWSLLAGCSTEAVVSTPHPDDKGPRSQSFREKILITHRGLSGPGILQISSYWSPTKSLTLDLVPDDVVFPALLARGASRSSSAAATRLREFLPARWANRWLELNLKPTRGDLSTVQLQTLEARLHQWTVTPNGTEGYAKAEVTAGGVSTAELDAKTMESRKVPGLYFIGEVVDVTGWLGGYNFQWAWSSGYCAGMNA